MSFFTDRSKLGRRFGGGVYCQKLSINVSFRPPDYYSVFQVEVAAVNVNRTSRHTSDFNI